MIIVAANVQQRALIIDPAQDRSRDADVPESDALRRGLRLHGLSASLPLTKIKITQNTAISHRQAGKTQLVTFDELAASATNVLSAVITWVPGVAPARTVEDLLTFPVVSVMWIEP